jgi:hypothetical protein
MNKTLVAALKRCRDITPTTLDEFLGPLLDRDPDDLARLPGTPGTVLAAQFTCYAKSSASLSEVLRRQAEEAGKLADAIWRIPAPKQTPSRNNQTEETNRDPDSLPDQKQCLACAAQCA